MVNNEPIRRTKSEPDLNLKSDDSKSESGLNTQPAMPKYNPGNLDRFLKAVTPSVNAQYQSDVQPWRQPYFVLNNLWEAYEEWSTMALGVTLVPEDQVVVEQYYTPYLSGIELYQQWTPSEPMNLFSGMNHDEDVDSNSAFSQNLNQNEQINEGTLNKKMNIDLLYQYLENEKPSQRKPFINKISELAAEFPQLMTLKSSDLLPDSWFSVSWYPIYRIPAGDTVMDLPVCFLTFHSLSTPKRGYPDNIITYRHDRWFRKISLAPFGLATYKYDFSHPIWKSSCGAQHESVLLNRMEVQAKFHMSVVQVVHPDLAFFLSNGGHTVPLEEKTYIRR